MSDYTKQRARQIGAVLAAMPPAAPAPGIIPTLPGKLAGAMPSTPGYVYHATNTDRLQDIADAGSLRTHKPHEFTDQDVWPDGSTQKRNYFTPSAANTWQFAPEEGQAALLRLPRASHPIQSERGTGDLYSTKPVPSSKLEYLGEGGGWHPVHHLKRAKAVEDE